MLEIEGSGDDEVVAAAAAESNNNDDLDNHTYMEDILEEVEVREVLETRYLEEEEGVEQVDAGEEDVGGVVEAEMVRP